MTCWTGVGVQFHSVIWRRERRLWVARSSSYPSARSSVVGSPSPLFLAFNEIGAPQTVPAFSLRPAPLLCWNDRFETSAVGLIVQTAGRVV